MEADPELPPTPPLSPSTLYLVATPIGNLEDVSARALRTLRECDVIAAEDTRRTGMLLRRFGIQCSVLISYHRFNEARRTSEILQRLDRGEKVALVSDAGSPGISDPGERLVAGAVGAGYRVEAVPGACALIPAMTASGLPCGEFHFAGFLPHKSGQRRRELERLRSLPGTLVLYESPYRVEKLLSELVDMFPRRRVVIARELTKKHEEYLRGLPAEILEARRGRIWKGEVTVMIGPTDVPGVHSRDAEGAGVTGGGRDATGSADGVCSSHDRNPLRLALAQMRVEPGRPEDNLARAESWIRRARDEGAGLILLPEVLDFGWTHSSVRVGAGPIPDGESVERLRRAAVGHGIWVCAGLAEREGDRLYNAAVLVGADGEVRLHHRKIHEIPFARALYSVGDRVGVADTPWGRLGLMICADALAPGNPVLRAMAAMGAEGVLSPCAWAVPPDHDNAKTPYGGLWVEHYGPVAGEASMWVAGCSNVGPILDGEWSGWRCIGNSLVLGRDGVPVHWGRHGNDAEELGLVTLPAQRRAD